MHSSSMKRRLLRISRCSYALRVISTSKNRYWCATERSLEIIMPKLKMWESLKMHLYFLLRRLHYREHRIWGANSNQWWWDNRQWLITLLLLMPTIVMLTYSIASLLTFLKLRLTCPQWGGKVEQVSLTKLLTIKWLTKLPWKLYQSSSNILMIHPNFITFLTKTLIWAMQ